MDVSHVYVYFLQVLTGGIPLPGVRDSAVGYHVLRGERPRQPEDPLVIGFSDSLWAFTERCWDVEMESRPKVKEVVTHLKEAAADWDGLMPPCPPTGDGSLDSGEAVSDSEEYSEFDIQILPGVTHQAMAQFSFHRPQVTSQSLPLNRELPLSC